MQKNPQHNPTPIPYRTSQGNPMRYVIISDDGTETEVTRAECLTRTDEPDNPYPQRWYVDEESGLVARLARNQKSEELARYNMRNIWREAKRGERWAGRIVPAAVDEDGNEVIFDPISDCDIAGIIEDKALLDTLYAALALLTEEDRSLITAIFRDGKSERALAPELGLKEPKSVNKRKHRILEQLRQNPALKEFFE